MPRSGSTWLYNVCITLLEYSGAEFSSLYADTDLDISSVVEYCNQHLLVKCHTIRGFSSWAESEANVFVTMRDPRDSVVSLMDMFGLQFSDALATVHRSTEDICEAVGRGAVGVGLRYEDGFLENQSAILRIARCWNIDVSESAARNIFNRFTRRNVQALIEKFQRDGLIGGDENRSDFEPRSHWHPRHLGDGKIGKYRELLSESEIAEVECVTANFMQIFYSKDAGAAGHRLEAGA